MGHSVCSDKSVGPVRISRLKGFVILDTGSSVELLLSSDIWVVASQQRHHDSGQRGSRKGKEQIHQDQVEETCCLSLSLYGTTTVIIIVETVCLCMNYDLWPISAHDRESQHIASGYTYKRS